MNRFTNHKDFRKVLITLLAFLGIISTFSIVSCSDTKEETIENKRWIRKKINSKEALNDLIALDKALGIMRKKDCKDPLSWYYQSSIHWIPDTIKNNQWCQFYHNVGDKLDAWDNCTHTPSGQEKLHFLVWHRLYIWHFEKIVRKLSGYDDFALPYWAYTNKNDRDKCMPDLFRDKHSSLYENARFDSLNKGWPVSGEISRALDLTKLMTYTDYQMFCSNIDGAPHGAMHDYIGAGNDTTGTLQFNNSITGTTTNTGLMGWVPTAAFDPIFWTHHSNIDRIWQQWHNSENGQSVTLEQLKEVEWSYVFFNENGEKVVYSMEEALEIIYTMDYDFDDTPVKSKEMRLTTNQQERELLTSITPSTKVSGKITSGIKLNGLLSANKSSLKKVKLEVVVSFTKIPKGLYEIYVNESGNHNPQNPTFAGFMNFFGTDHKMSGESCEKGCCRKLNKEGRPELTFVYEVPVSKEYNITIYKDNGKHTGDLTIDKVSIIK